MGWPWTADEDEVLRRMHRTKRTVSEMARRLNRSAPLIDQRLRVLKLGRHAKPPALGKLLLMAAASLGETFTEADLVVACWRLAPIRFGLRGFPRHPDSKTVVTTLLHRGGPVRRGRIERVAPLTFRLTASGRRLARWRQTA